MQGISKKAIYGFLGTGTVLAFFGHGVFGAKGKESFIELVQGSYDKVLGGSMSVDAATSIVNVVGWIDIVLAIVFAGLVYAALTDKPIAYSRPAMWLFGWAMVWGFLTALSRFSATLNGNEVWDVVERGPNYFAPAAVLYIVYRSRHAAAPVANREPVANLTGRPIPSH